MDFKISYLTPEADFPDPKQAMKDPDGLLAIGGDLSPVRLIAAYKKGIFPWFNEDDPIMWWSPSQRMILYPNQFKLRHSLRKTLKKDFVITVDQAFEQVIANCSQLRQLQQGTWITSEMQQAYITLHQLGIAHSIEVWLNEKLVGGLYGLSLGHAFFGESMFHLERDASKVALYALCNLPFSFDFIDCQLDSPHLNFLGASPISREQFLELLTKTLTFPNYTVPWPCPARPSKTLLG